jgi:hypothetical protein
LKDILDGITAWDGRLSTTVRRLYTRPGAVARDFLDGRRARHSPPFRLYIIAILASLAVLSAFGITVLGVHIEETPAAASVNASFVGAGVGDLDVSLRFFRPRWEAPPEPVPLEALLANVSADGDSSARDLESALAEMDDAGRGVVGLAVRILADPIGVERQLALVLSQAALFMVIGFAILNLCLHPHAPIITHAIHSLYFHAASFPFLTLSVLANVFASLAAVYLSHLIGGATVLAVLAYAFFADRRVYGSSRLGAAVRLPALAIGYLLTFLAMVITLIVTTVS